MERPGPECLLLVGLIGHPELAVASGLEPSDLQGGPEREAFARLLARLAAGEVVTQATVDYSRPDVPIPTADETGLLARDAWGAAVARRGAAQAEALSRKGVRGEAFLEAMAAHLDGTSRSGQETSRVRDLALSVAETLVSPVVSGANRVRFGLPNLDHRVKGMLRGVPIVVGARPGVGKSGFARSVTREVVRRGQRALVFSLEDSRHQYVMRVLGDETGIPPTVLEEGGVNLGHIPPGLPAGWYLDDTAGLTSRALCRRARLVAHRAGGLDLVVVDYVQLLRSERLGASTPEIIKDGMADLARLARDLNCPVMVLSQINRGAEHEARRPTMADLKWSGSLEEVAKMVILLHRPFAGDEDTVMHAHVEKNSFGAAGQVVLGWEGALTRVT